MIDECKDRNADFLEKENSNPLSENNSNIRPFVRFGARCIDIILFSITIGILLFICVSTIDLNLHPILDAIIFFWAIGGPILFAMQILFVWVFVEAGLLSLWGSTPGKWLLCIKINDANGGKPKFLNALRRSFKVWFFGFGTGYPLISIYTHISGYSELTIRGITRWDKNEKFTVTHEKIGIVRAAVAIIIFSIPIATFFIE